MEIEAAMNQLVNVPIALLYGSFICGGLFFLILDGLSGLVTMLITKAIEKIKKKKEHSVLMTVEQFEKLRQEQKERENGSNNS